MANALAAGLVLVALTGASGLAAGRAQAWAAHAGRLLRLSEAPAMLLNNAAWLIAVSDEPSNEVLGRALRLAEQATWATLRRDPNILDTLAELQFQVGERGEALATIEEAVALAPDQPYFREQRRRFAGERPSDDRPAPPREWAPPPRRPPRPTPEIESPGLSV